MVDTLWKHVASCQVMHVASLACSIHQTWCRSYDDWMWVVLWSYPAAVTKTAVVSSITAATVTRSTLHLMLTAHADACVCVLCVSSASCLPEWGLYGMVFRCIDSRNLKSAWCDEQSISATWCHEQGAVCVASCSLVSSPQQVSAAMATYLLRAARLAAQ